VHDLERVGAEEQRLESEERRRQRELEQALVAAGSVRVRDAERGGRTLVLSTGSSRARRAFAAEAARWRVQLSRDLRRSGAECLWLRSDRSPLFALARFFQERAGRRLGGSR